MMRDTVFDVASLTKVVVTTPLVMQLVGQDTLSIIDQVCRWLPEFSDGGRDRITIRHLLTHSAGLPAHRNLRSILGGSVAQADRRRKVAEVLCRLPLDYAPDTSAIYSCLGFILLGEIIEAASGRSVSYLAHKGIFQPLGMRDTGFCPDAPLADRCAATEQLPSGTLVGVVHDENSRYLGGVSGNAGLFSTAEDLARFVRALAFGGTVLRPESVERMFAEEPERGGLRRCLGWRMANADDPHMHGAPNVDCVGHTGYTGTSLWIHRPSGVFAILLTNRVHLGRDVEVEPLRRRVGEIVEKLIGAAAS